MTTFLAAAPLLCVLILMLGLRWSGARSGLVGLLVSIALGWARFGLQWEVLWVSQVRGLALSFFVLYIIWAALLTYNLVEGVVSSALEGIAGFGVPLAVVSPILVSIGLDPVTAVAAAAVGHAWSVTFGDMGVVFEALASVVGISAQRLAPASALMLGVMCICSGFAVARLVGIRGCWLRVAILGLVMSVTQAGLAMTALRPLAAFAAGGVGLLAGARLFQEGKAGRQGSSTRTAMLAVMPYALTATLLATVTFVPALSASLGRVQTRFPLPPVRTAIGWETGGGYTKAIQWLEHPGTLMLVSVGLVLPFYHRHSLLHRGLGRMILRSTFTSALPASLGVTSMVALAMVMDHTGMTQTLAQAAARGLERYYPLVSAFLGVVGSFATGSNTNSNVLLGPLQLSVAHALDLKQVWLLAAQTAGGALGSMVAPAKLVVGCAAVGLTGQEGKVLRCTAPRAALLALGAGILAWLLA